MKATTHLVLTFLVVLSACATEPEPPSFELYREAVRRELRDPDSAQFKDERIRTLWAEGGSQRIVYCAEVNGKNALGGNAGFAPAIYVIEAWSPFPGANFGNWTTGKAVIYSRGKTTDFYLFCERTDTQRREEDLRVVTPDLYPLNAESRAQADAAVPVLSMEQAPAR